MAELPSQETPLRLQGKLLLAAPSFTDGIFNRSVVLIADHNEVDGAFGLILNQPSGHQVGDFLKNEEFSGLSRIAVHVGGPVARQHLTFSALWWTEEKGLRFATRLSAHDAVKHSSNPGTLIRAFVGYSGWAEGQLEAEIKRDSWITASPSSQLLGHSHDQDLWVNTLRDISPFHRILAEAPPKPSQN
ncbi:MAG: YqgE/AlgH family protein [Akkermansiaceae bacterium]|jgi:putative transcriptional regulator|nr:YqgE/AlgH family protein [Akkermansiaceae bacterium]